MKRSIKITAKLLANRASILKTAAINMNYTAIKISYIAATAATTAVAIVTVESLILKISYSY